MTSATLHDTLTQMAATPWLWCPLALTALLLLTQCTTVGKPMRLPPETKDSAGKTIKTPAKESWYIETKPRSGGGTYSCSFVEFDGRGDFIDFRQYRQAWEKVNELSKEGSQKLLLVQYCHGWKNNSQSGDVVEFNGFLKLLADSPDIQAAGYRVHGVYLAWRGNVFQPSVDTKSQFYRDAEADYGEPVLDARHRRWLPLLPFVGEQLSYWGRKRAAEYHVAGAPLARTVFACSHLAKKRGKDNKVFLIGHSMGALMLEKSIGQAMVGQISEAYPWFGTTPDDRVNPTPFDMLLLLNSASPSIHSKQLSEVLWGHYRALHKDKENVSKKADAPLVVSLTSTADSATRYVHFLANSLAHLSPSLRRSYTNVLTDSPHLPEKEQKDAGSLHQSYYYRRTAGHNPLLVDHWIIPEPHPPGHVPCGQCGEVLQANLRRDPADPTVFFTSPKTQSPNEKAAAWRITSDAAVAGVADWKKIAGHHAKTRVSNYWTVRCPEDLIGGHNDIWTPTTMEMYAALFRLVRWNAEH